MTRSWWRNRWSVIVTIVVVIVLSWTRGTQGRTWRRPCCTWLSRSTWSSWILWRRRSRMMSSKGMKRRIEKSSSSCCCWTRIRWIQERIRRGCKRRKRRHWKSRMEWIEWRQCLWCLMINLICIESCRKQTRVKESSGCCWRKNRMWSQMRRKKRGMQ